MKKTKVKKGSNSNAQFDGQREGETVLLVFRRHIIAMRKGFYLFLGPFAILSIPVFIWQDSLWMLLFPLVGFIIGLMLFLYHFILWYYTIFIVTDQRIRQITQYGFFGKDVVEIKLSKIQSISYHIPGFSGEILKYGNIIIQTLVGDLLIKNVEHPSEIYEALQDAVNDVSADREVGHEEIEEEEIDD